MRRHVIGLVLVLLAAGCGSSSDRGELTGADSGDEVFLETGTELEIRLDSNPTTGFSWSMSPGSTGDFLQLVSSTYEAPDSDLVGASGTEVFVFEATHSGAGVLRLEYIRPFDDPPIAERVAESGSTASPGPETPTHNPTHRQQPPPGPEAVIDVEQLFDGEGQRDATVAGFLLWDNAGARLCGVLMESFPPQCGDPWIVIANPEGLDTATMEQAQGVRWTDRRIEVGARFDGVRLVLLEGAASAVPTEQDQNLVSAFLSHAEGPTAETTAALPFADSTSIGLGDQIVSTVTRADLADPDNWTIDVNDYQGFAGPFSALEIATGPVRTTIGAHPRCAGPPAAPPAGFEDLRRISIQPETSTSCIDWWTIDFFVGEDGLVQAMTMDLFGP